jgi:hypothetical protein
MVVVMNKIKELIKELYGVKSDVDIMKVYFEIYQYCKSYEINDTIEGDVLLYLENKSILKC